MPAKKWRPWAWGLACAILGTGLYAGYLFVRQRFGQGSAAPSLMEQALAAGILLLPAMVLFAHALRRHYRNTLDELTRRLRPQSKSPSLHLLHSLPASGPAATDVQPLLEQIIGLVSSYRAALAERVQRNESSPPVTGMPGEGDRSFSAFPTLPGTAAYTKAAERMIARLAPTLHWLAATPAMQQFLGRSLADLNARPFLDLVHPEDREALSSALQEALKDGEGHNITFRIRAADGQDRFLQTDVLARYTEEGTPLHLRCHFFDISERVATERALRQRTEELSHANERLRDINTNLERLKESYGDLYHQAPVAYFSLDERGYLVACNETMLQTLDYGRDDLVGRPYDRLLTPVSRQHYQHDPAVFQRSAEVEAERMKSDGSIMEVSIRTAPELDDAGRFVRSRSVARDVTERTRLANAIQAKAEELQQANAQLRHINQELEEFTYVVSHDLKEPLRTLQAFSNFLAEDYSPELGPEGQEHINYLIEASRRLGLLIDDLLTLSRAGRAMNTPRVFDLATAIRTVRSDLADLIQRKEAVVHVEGELPAVAGDSERVIQLLTNLVANGLKYNRSSHPEIFIGQAHAIEAPPGQVTLFVRDNGIGIDPHYHEQIFRIFRRLHHREEYDGTGAGLAICKKIVEAHGGRLWLESAPGKGTTFYFTLSGQSAAKGQRWAAAGSAGHGPEAALLENNITHENI